MGSDAGINSAAIAASILAANMANAPNLKGKDLVQHVTDLTKFVLGIENSKMEYGEGHVKLDSGETIVCSLVTQGGETDLESPGEEILASRASRVSKIANSLPKNSTPKDRLHAAADAVAAAFYRKKTVRSDSCDITAPNGSLVRLDLRHLP